MSMKPDCFQPAARGRLPDLLPPVLIPEKQWKRRKPVGQIALLAVILLGCLFAELLAPGNAALADLSALNGPPDAAHWFGTDPMGRDLFAMILHGGQISLLVGLGAAMVSALLAVLCGCAAGLAPPALGNALMRADELLLSIPSILLVVFLQAAVGNHTPVSIALIIGCTSWMTIAKVVHSEVLRIKSSEYFLAARTMGCGFFYLLWRHLLPGFLPSILFMVVSNIGTAIAAESTLSFLGLGLAFGTVSWGSILSAADRSLLSGAWWVIVIPGAFLATTLVCINDIGLYLRGEEHHRCSNL